MLSINGVFENGQIRLLENLSVPNGTRVIVTFLEEKFRVQPGFTEEQFWDIVSKINWDSEDVNEQILPCITALAKFTPDDICQFEEILAGKLYQLDGKKFAQNLGEFSYGIGSSFSPEMFLNIRCYAITMGKDYYEKILEVPNLLTEGEFEPLLHIGEAAYKTLTGKDIVINTTRSYETFANKSAWD